MNFSDCLVLFARFVFCIHRFVLVDKALLFADFVIEQKTSLIGQTDHNNFCLVYIYNSN